MHATTVRPDARAYRAFVRNTHTLTTPGALLRRQPLRPPSHAITYNSTMQPLPALFVGVTRIIGSYLRQ